MTGARSSLRRQLDVLTAGLLITVAAYSLSLDLLVQAGRPAFICLSAGLLVLGCGIVLLRRQLTGRLRRLLDGITAIQRSGRPIKLPVQPADELGTVAAAFNDLLEQVDAHKRRLRQHIVELQRLNLEFDELANVKDEFLGAVNHQLRTPLTTLVQGIALMTDGTLGPLNPEQKDLLTMMDAHAKQLAALVEDVLDLSLLKSGRRPLNRRPADLAALLRELEAAWGSQRPACPLRVTCGALPDAYMDRQAVEDVLQHLLRNAARHAPVGSDIELEAASRDGMMEVRVTDHGPGLSDEQAAKLFQPFVHLQTPDNPGSQGNGLGLAYCRQVIERHRGTITAAQAPGGQGMRFTFTLPAASEAFLFREACETAREAAEYEEGQYGVCFVAVEAAGGAAAPVSARAETVLRGHTHRGDQFVRLEDGALAIVAVTDRHGLDLMAGRLRQLVRSEGLDVRLAVAGFPADGATPEELLRAAVAAAQATQGARHG